MGIGPGYKYRHKSYPRTSANSAAPNNNPDPKNFTILREELVGDCLVLSVKYPDATNYEGIKIMVYQGFENSRALLAQTNGLLDPHFSTEVSPVARFKPDGNGWANAVKFAGLIK